MIESDKMDGNDAGDQLDKWVPSCRWICMYSEGFYNIINSVIIVNTQKNLL